MAAITYSEDLPDYTDLENTSKKRPGFTVEVNDQDGGVGLNFYPPGQIPASSSQGVWMTIAQAKKLVEGLNDAIQRSSKP